jgi:hypothetical protein
MWTGTYAHKTWPFSFGPSNTPPEKTQLFLSTPVPGITPKSRVSPISHSRWNRNSSLGSGSFANEGGWVKCILQVSCSCGLGVVETGFDSHQAQACLSCIVIEWIGDDECLIVDASFGNLRSTRKLGLLLILYGSGSRSSAVLTISPRLADLAALSHPPVYCV